MNTVIPLKKIWFFDDDSFNTPTDKQLKFINFVKIIPGRHGDVLNDYDITLAKEDNNAKAYYPDSGVKNAHLENIKTNIDKIRALVFDWDKTFTLFEGVSFGLPSYGVKNLQQSIAFLKKYKYIPDNWTKLHFIKYILHDKNEPNRFKRMSLILKLAQSKNIPIFILTNNAMPINQKQIFIDVFNILGVVVPAENIFKGGSSGPKRKGKTIMEDIIPRIETYEQNNYGDEWGLSFNGGKKSKKKGKKKGKKKTRNKNKGKKRKTRKRNRKKRTKRH